MVNALKKTSASALLVTGLAICGVGLWLLLSPAQYRAMTKVKIMEDQEVIEKYWKAHPEKRPRIAYDPFVPDAFVEDLLSDKVLTKAVEILRRDQRWYQQTGGEPPTTNRATKMLGKKVTILLPTKHSANPFIICATDESPEEAAAIANAIADAYNERYEYKRYPLIQIRERAVPPQTPIRPNRWLGAFLFSVGFVTSVCGFSFLKSSVKHSA